MWNVESRCPNWSSEWGAKLALLRNSGMAAVKEKKYLTMGQIFTYATFHWNMSWIQPSLPPPAY